MRLSGLIIRKYPCHALWARWTRFDTRKIILPTQIFNHTPDGRFETSFRDDGV